MNKNLNSIFSPTDTDSPKLSLSEVGSVTKTDGTTGAVLVKLAPEADSDEVFNSEFLFLMIDGGVVPMRIKSVTKRGDRSATISLASVHTPSQAQHLVGAKVCSQVEAVPDDEVETVQPLVGYMVVSVDSGEVGIIEEIDDSVAANPLFVVRRADGCEVLLPATDDFVVAIDDDAQTITLQLPGGLLDIENADMA
ncbi:MAG: hypothetical protein II375_05260 [Bacteroidales bacterium]|nr:hypothetical protein [Bacteroidales bacterium]